jgi:hypothetical protein
VAVNQGWCTTQALVSIVRVQVSLVLAWVLVPVLVLAWLLALG